MAGPSEKTPGVELPSKGESSRPPQLLDLASGRANNFDALRLFLASLVIVSHSYPLLWGSNDREPLSQLSSGQMTLGEVAVNGFFIMSGFLITASWGRCRGPADYLRRRILRIVPGYTAAVILSGLVAAPLLAANPREYWGKFDAGSFILHAANLEGAQTPGPPINGSLWSIRYEFFCYLAVVALGIVGVIRRRGLVLLILATCSAIYAFQLILDIKMPGSRLSHVWCPPRFWPRLATCFFAGCAFYLYGDRLRCDYRAAALAAVLLALATLAPRAHALPILFPLLGGYVLFAAASIPSRWMGSAARFGDFSYGLYLYAFPIQLLFIKWLGPRLAPSGLSLASGIATLGLAALSWHFIEKPCLRWKRPTPIHGGVLQTLKRRSGAGISPSPQSGAEPRA